MDVAILIEKQRESYLKQLTIFYKQESKQALGAKELLVKLNSSKRITLFKLYRFDYLTNVNGEQKIIEFSPQKHMSHSKITARMGGMTFDLYPFFWSSCEFIITKQQRDLNGYKKRTKKRIDVEDNNPINKDGYSGVIHSAYYPTTTNKITKIMVDFGTAPADAFWELLELFETMGQTKVIVGSFEALNIQAQDII